MMTLFTQDYLCARWLICLHNMTLWHFVYVPASEIFHSLKFLNIIMFTQILRTEINLNQDCRDIKHSWKTDSIFSKLFWTALHCEYPCMEMISVDLVSGLMAYSHCIGMRLGLVQGTGQVQWEAMDPGSFSYLIPV